MSIDNKGAEGVFDQMVCVTHNRKITQKQELETESKLRLLKIIEKKFKTTFIGAISQIEQHFGYLWGHDERNFKLSEEEKEFKQIFDVVRNNILNNGNNQLRSIENELEQYTTVWNAYKLKFEAQNPGGSSTTREARGERERS